MSQVIIYNQDNGVPAVVTPAPDALKTMTIEQIAAKSVPAGKRYGIFSENDLPQNAPQESWVISDSQLSAGIGEKQ
jgi:hypothetical protein